MKKLLAAALLAAFASLAFGQATVTATAANGPTLDVTSGITGTVGITNGGTGRATSTTAYGLIAAGTTATGTQQTLSAGATTDILVGGGASALPAWTTATGSGAPVRATSPVLVTPTLGAASATSVNFGGTSLANYVEGTWTAADGTAAALSITNTTTKYTRIGRMVLLNFDISYPANADATNAVITGLPITALADQAGGGTCHQGTGGAGTMYWVFVQPSTVTFFIYNASGTRMSNAGLTGVRLRCTASYSL